MPNRKKTVLQREEELAKKIMEDVNAGIDARLERFERMMERFAPTPEAPVIPPPEPAVMRSKKRTADLLQPEEEETPTLSKPAKKIRSRPSSHTTSHE